MLAIRAGTSSLYPATVHALPPVLLNDQARLRCREAGSTGGFLIGMWRELRRYLMLRSRTVARRLVTDQRGGVGLTAPRMPPGAAGTVSRDVGADSWPRSPDGVLSWPDRWAI
jgi:hypothetical protein